MTRLIDKKLADEVAEITRGKTREELISLIEKQAVIIKQLRSSETELATKLQLTCNQLATDCISRQAAKLKVARVIWEDGDSCYDFHDKCVDCLDDVPSAQPEQSTVVQEILQYMDEYLHPIVSPEHWYVYSELHDMVSMLPSAQPERKKGRWIVYYECPKCGEITKDFTECCPFCGADMRGEQDD